MNAREVMRGFIPPIVARAVGKAIGVRADIGEYDRLQEYDSFDSALADSESYAHPDIVELVARRTEADRQVIANERDRIVEGCRVLQNLFVLSHLECARPLSVLELGGACGATFFELDHLLPEMIGAWHVVELAATVEAGRRRFQTDRLRFCDDLESAVQGLGGRHLLMTQGGLQCVRNPMATLEGALRLGFAYVYITRFEVSDELERPTIVRLPDRLSANGPGPVPTDLVDRNTSYPATIFPRDFVRAALPRAYEVAFTFVESEKRPKLIGPREITTRKAGLLLKKVA